MPRIISLEAEEKFQDHLRRTWGDVWHGNGEKRQGGVWRGGWYDRYDLILPPPPARIGSEDSPLPDPVPIEVIEIPGGLTQEEIDTVVGRALAKAGIVPEDGHPPLQTDPEAEEPPPPKRKGRFQNLEL